jgi:hypothetical protein
LFTPPSGWLSFKGKQNFAVGLLGEFGEVATELEPADGALGGYFGG